MVYEGLVSVDMLERNWCFCFDLIHQNFQFSGNILVFFSPSRMIKISSGYLKFDVVSAAERGNLMPVSIMFLVCNPKLINVCNWSS